MGAGKGKRDERKEGARDGLRPNRGGAEGDKTEEALFHLSNYIYLSLTHKQTRQMALTE